MLGQFYKRKDSDRIWWIHDIGTKGQFLFSFDKETIFNFFRDYPEKLTQEQKELFDKENPELAAFRAGKYKADDWDE